MTDQDISFARDQLATESTGRLFGDSLNQREALRLLSYGSLLLCDLAAIQAGFAIAAHWRGAYWLQLYGFPVAVLFSVVYTALALTSGSVTRDAFGSSLRSAMLGERTLLMASALCIAILFFQPHGLTLSRLALLTAMLCSAVFIGLGRLAFLSLFLRNRAEFWTSCIMLLDGAPAPRGTTAPIRDAKDAGIDPERNDPAILARLGHLLAHYDKVVVVCADQRRANAWSLVLKAFDIRAEIVMPSDLPLGAIGVGRMGDRPTLIVNRGQLVLADRIKKRIVDILFSGLAIIVLAPLLVVIALAIRIDSPGPVLFRQLRVGYGNRPFRILKFRSLRHDVADRDGNRSVSAGDTRVTRVGALIRRTSIDELPQLFNVVEGLERVSEIPYGELQSVLDRANLVVCHAGTGSIITALSKGCAVVAVPRTLAHGDHYDDHQVEIASVIASRGLVETGGDAQSIAAALDRARTMPRHRVRMNHRRLIGFLDQAIDTWFPPRALTGATRALASFSPPRGGSR